MIAKTFLIEAEQWERIRLKAFEDRVSCGEIIRRAIGEYVKR